MKRFFFRIQNLSEKEFRETQLLEKKHYFYIWHPVLELVGYELLVLDEHLLNSDKSKRRISGQIIVCQK